MMDRLTFNNFYDALCKALTCYEAAVNDNSDYDAGCELYHDIIEIVNDMENYV